MAAPLRFALRPFDVSYFDEAPERYVFIQHLDCSPAELFDIFKDEHSWPQWAFLVSRVTWTSPRPFGVGTTRIVKVARFIDFDAEFIAWTPGKHMASCVVGASLNPRSDTFGEDYRVTDLDGGRCRLTWTVVLAPRGVIRLMQVFLRPVIRFALGKMSRGLGEYVAAGKHKTAPVGKLAAPSSSAGR